MLGKRRGRNRTNPGKGSLTDNGFEDRGAHQVLISLHTKLVGLLSISSHWSMTMTSVIPLSLGRLLRHRLSSWTTSTIFSAASSTSASVEKIDSDNRRLLKARSSLIPMAV